MRPVVMRAQTGSDESPNQPEPELAALASYPGQKSTQNTISL